MTAEIDIGDRLNDMHLTVPDMLQSTDEYQRRGFMACVVGWLYLAEQDGLLLSTDLAKKAGDLSRRVTKRVYQGKVTISNEHLEEADRILSEILALQGYNRLEA